LTVPFLVAVRAPGVVPPRTGTPGVTPPPGPEGRGEGSPGRLGRGRGEGSAVGNPLGPRGRTWPPGPANLGGQGAAKALPTVSDRIRARVTGADLWMGVILFPPWSRVRRGYLPSYGFRRARARRLAPVPTPGVQNGAWHTSEHPRLIFLARTPEPRARTVPGTLLNTCLCKNGAWHTSEHLGITSSVRTPEP